MAELTNEEAPDSVPSPHDDAPTLPSTGFLFLVVVGFVLGGALLGLAIAYTVAGGSPVAVFVGFMALPIAFGFALSAWRALLGAWLATSVGRALWRSRGDEAHFREELGQSLASARRQGMQALPGTWVFLPVTGAVGLVGGLLMAIAAEANGALAGALLLVAAIFVGVAMRRLARTGRLPIPE